ncbi:MAG: glycosyltransferase family 4 protein, partial [Candidatus Binatia bacterium]
SLRARRLHRRRRTVYTNLGSPVREWWDSQPDRNEHERVVRDIDVYGCLSSFALRSLRDDFEREGTLLPGGVRMTAFRPVAPRTPEPTVLYSGALDEPRKGVDVLLEAIALAAEREPKIRLWLSGQGDAARLLEAAPPRARSRTEVLPIGSPDDLPERYSAAWVTALPSVGEAFGLVLVESLACGTPIVGCDHSSLPELVRPGIGALARPRDARSLATACLEAIELAAQGDVVDQCREAARPYDWDAAVAPMVERAYLG